MSDYFEIHIPCTECENGKVYWQTSVDTYKEFNCEYCGSLGYKIVGDYYDSVKELLLDYPDAIKMEVLR